MAGGHSKPSHIGFLFALFSPHTHAHNIHPKPSSDRLSSPSSSFQRTRSHVFGFVVSLATLSGSSCSWHVARLPRLRSADKELSGNNAIEAPARYSAGKPWSQLPSASSLAFSTFSSFLASSGAFSPAAFLSFALGFFLSLWTSSPSSWSSSTRRRSGAFLGHLGVKSNKRAGDTDTNSNQHSCDSRSLSFQFAGLGGIPM